jgi:hypothetical protein
MPNHPSIIARPTATGLAGRYVHNDGHPKTRLPLLRQLYTGPFAGDVDAMTRFLIDAHPAGWSQLGTDPNRETGWINPCPPPGDHGFRCYCHGDRHDPPLLVTHNNVDPDLAPWIYLLRPEGLHVLEGRADGAFHAWPLSPWNSPQGTAGVA